jgi:hypothetical protein
MTTANGTNGHPPTLNADEWRRLESLVENAAVSRANFVRGLLDPRRNIDKECGYPESDIDAERLQHFYDRDAVASRVVEVLPKESWQVTPEVYEEEEGETVTAFEEAWDNLSRQLRGEQSHYQDEKGGAVWEYLIRADILSRVGRYGVILVGIDDGLRLSEPAKGIEELFSMPAQKGDAPADLTGVYSFSLNADAVSGRKLKYLRVFPESLASIVRFETNPTSPRYGQPVSYRLAFGDPTATTPAGTQPRSSAEVHWSRIVHVADNLRHSEVFGVPALQPVFNRLYDLKKIFGASGEGYWKSGIGTLVLETNPQLAGAAPRVDSAGVRDMVESLWYGLEKGLYLNQMSAKMLSPSITDPTPYINAQIEAICIQLGIPVRVFKGSERGELASSQDDAAWNDRLKARQCGYLTPRVIVPFVDRLIMLGVLPEPSGYSVYWPDLTSHSDGEKADVCTKKTAALAQYVQSGASEVVGEHDYLTRFQGFSDEEATAILEEADARQQEADAAAQQLAADQGYPPGFAPAPAADPNLAGVPE